MSDLKPCPCGETPTSLFVTPTQTSKYANVSGDCCGEWMIEFRTHYHDTESAECMKLAEAAWYEAPRAGDEG